MEIEKALVGSVVTDENCIDMIRQYVPDGSFLKNQLFGRILDAVINLHTSGKPVDISTVSDAANLQGDALQQLMQAADIPTAANAEQYAKTIREHYVRRMIAGVRSVDPLDANKYPTPLDAINEIEKKTSEAMHIMHTDETTMKEIVLSEYDKYCEEHDMGKNPNLISTGFYDLDNLIDALEKGENIIIAARPSMGKTALGLCLCRNVAMQGKKALIFSLEMRKERLVSRMVCIEGRINATRFKRRQLTADEYGRLVTVMGKVGELPMIIRDDVRTTTEIRSIVARETARGEVGIVLIDFLTLLSDPQPRGANTSVHVGNMAKAIQQIGHTYNVPMVTLAQLNRSVETRNVKRPALSDLRESGNIEEAADKVLFIYRENYYSQEGRELPTEVEISAAKTRDGETGACKLLWTPEFTRYDNLAKEGS